MSKYTSREQLFEDYLKRDTTLWYDWIDSLLVPANTVTIPLYHVSFNNNLPRHIKPVSPYNTDPNVSPHVLYHEPLPNRISTSSSIEGCWSGIYANYSALFENKVRAHPKITLQVYRVTPHRNARILTPSVAVSEWLNYDAHVTQEYSIFGECTLEHIGEVVLDNTTDAPDGAWVQFYPFDKPRYKRHFLIPPYQVTHSTMSLEQQPSDPILPFHMENPMTTDVVTFTCESLNRTHLSQINIESFSNPFSGMSDAIKRNIHRVVANLPSFNKDGTQQSELATNYAALTTQYQPMTVKSIKYSDIRGVNVVVPVGFHGNYVKYLQALLRQFSALQHIVKEVIAPSHNLVLKYIGKPETMTTIDNADISRIKFHHKEIETFKKEMNRMFDTKKKHQAQTIGTLVGNAGELGKLNLDIKKGIVPWMFNASWSNDVYRNYSDFQKSIDLLLVRIEQKPDVYSLNKLNAERLAKLINDVAIEVELAAAMYTYLNEFLVCVIQLNDKTTTLAQVD